MWIPLAFIGFLSIAVVSGALADYLKKKAGIDLLKSAIEKGQALDPALVDRLLSEGSPANRHDARTSFRFVGLMCLSTGIGLAVLGQFFSGFSDKILPALTGIGALLVCISAGWFAAAWFAKKDAIKTGKET